MLITFSFCVPYLRLHLHYILRCFFLKSIWYGVWGVQGEPSDAIDEESFAWKSQQRTGRVHRLEASIFCTDAIAA